MSGDGIQDEPSGCGQTDGRAQAAATRTALQRGYTVHHLSFILFSLFAIACPSIDSFRGLTRECVSPTLYACIKAGKSLLLCEIQVRWSFQKAASVQLARCFFYWFSRFPCCQDFAIGLAFSHWIWCLLFVYYNWCNKNDLYFIIIIILNLILNPLPSYLQCLFPAFKFCAMKNLRQE